MADGDDWISETSSWMENISDEALISRISIPGTHGSAAFKWGVAFKCQTWPVSKQLEEGIRFLDIHVRKYESSLYVYQWSCNQGVRLDDILKTVLKYLEHNPSECVLIRIWEDKICMSDPGIWSIVHDYVTKIGVEKFWLKNVIPSLSDVRGLIVFLKNFNGSEMGIEHNMLQELQEASVPTLFSLGSAWNNIEQQLQEIKITAENKLCVSYCSGASWGAYPQHVASYFNARLLKFLQNPKCRSCAAEVSEQLQKSELQLDRCNHMYGIIAMDFPDRYLVEKIIENNF